MFECLLDPKQWGYAVMVFCVSLVSGGISAFGPLVLAGFGLNNYQTILYNMIPGAIGIVANLMWVDPFDLTDRSAAYFAQRYKKKAPVLLVVLLFPVAAAAALYTIPRDGTTNQELLAVYFILQIFQPLTPLLFSWA